jgi:hypothetical protein
VKAEDRAGETTAKDSAQNFLGSPPRVLAKFGARPALSLLRGQSSAQRLCRRLPAKGLLMKLDG